MVTYADNFTLTLQPVTRRGIYARGQNKLGYGNRISTDYVLQFTDNPRKYRVYAICWSNVASHYVRVNGQQLFVRDLHVRN